MSKREQDNISLIEIVTLSEASAEANEQRRQRNDNRHHLPGGSPFSIGIILSIMRVIRILLLQQISRVFRFKMSFWTRDVMDESDIVVKSNRDRATEDNKRSEGLTIYKITYALMLFLVFALVALIVFMILLFHSRYKLYIG